MKWTKWMVGLCGVGLLVALACGSNVGSAQESQGQSISSVDVAQGPDRPRNPQAYEPRSRPFGTSVERWSEKLWQWVYSVPNGQNPLLDTTGVDCAVDQPDGPVWFLPPVLDPGTTASFTRTCTVPQGKALLMLTSGVLNDYPCPQPGFQPADGQTLYEFLLAGAQGGPDSVSAQSLYLDGVKLLHIYDYRETSDDLFDLTGSLSLQSTLDGCITASPQPAVSDAFVIMLKALPTGPHTLVYNAQDARGVNVTLTYNLTIQ